MSDMNENITKEIELIKNQIANLKMKFLIKEVKDIVEIFNCRADQIEERIFNPGNKNFEITPSGKSLHKIWDTITQPNIIWVFLKKKKRNKSIENLLNKTLEENFPGLEKDLDMYIQES